MVAPGQRAIDGRTEFSNPAGDLLDDLLFLFVDSPVATDGYAEQLVAVLGYHIAQCVDDGCRCLVAASLVERAIEVPVADAGVGLPRKDLDTGLSAALNILDQAHSDRRRHVLSVDHDIWTAAPARRAGIVVMRGDREPVVRERLGVVIEVELV